LLRAHPNVSSPKETVTPQGRRQSLPSLRSEIAREPVFFRAREIVNVIRKQLKPEKDLITPKMIFEISNCAVNFICKLFNGIKKLGYSPKNGKRLLLK